MMKKKKFEISITAHEAGTSQPANDGIAWINALHDTSQQIKLKY